MADAPLRTRAPAPMLRRLLVSPLRALLARAAQRDACAIGGRLDTVAADRARERVVTAPRAAEGGPYGTTTPATAASSAATRPQPRV